MSHSPRGTPHYATFMSFILFITTIFLLKGPPTWWAYTLHMPVMCKWAYISSDVENSPLSGSWGTQRSERMEIDHVLSFIY
jgi:hypothetical protein